MSVGSGLCAEAKAVGRVILFTKVPSVVQVFLAP